MAGSRELTIALLAVPETTVSTLYGLYDLFAGTRRDWQLMVHGVEAESPLRPRVVSRDGRPLCAANGVRVEPDAALDALPRPDIAIVSDLAVPPGQRLDDRYEPELRWLRQAHGAGATLASACSGAVLLARTGLLDRLDATTHWGYCDALQREYPTTRWHPGSALVVSGVGQRIVMAGSGTSWHALALYLIARFVGPQEAMQGARLNLLDWDPSGALAYASLSRVAQVGDPVVARCQEWAAQHYDREAPVQAMAALSGLPERTFKRRFAQATGMSPLEYVQTLRLEEAKQMLEAGEQPVEAIAVEVGYQDASFFGRLFRRRVGMTPAHYRRRFGALSRRLHDAAA